MIVITTPTGQISHQVLDNVRESAEAIRVIARNPSRLDSKTHERVEVVQGSHDDIRVVTQAFAGADCVFWLDFTCPACEAIKSQASSISSQSRL